MFETKKIESLTEEQRARLAALREDWLRQLFSTERANHQRAEAGLLALRAELRMAKPPVFVWCESPVTCLLAIELLLAKKRAPIRELLLRSPERLQELLRKSLRYWDSGFREPVALWDYVWAMLRESFSVPQRASLRAALDEAMDDSPWAAIRASLSEPLERSLSDSLERYLWEAAPWRYPQMAFIASQLFCRDVLGLQWPPDQSRRLDLRREVARSCCWWLSLEDYVVVSERPTSAATDPWGRLHCEDGPALVFADGWKIFALHGVRVDRRVIEQPWTITVGQIENESNVAVRHALIERYGTGQYLSDSGAEEVHRDGRGVLYRKDQPGGEPMMMVKVVNSTPEPDGSVRQYFLRVDPQLRPLSSDGPTGRPQALTATNAIASTFGKRGEEYAPEVET